MTSALQIAQKYFTRTRPSVFDRGAAVRLPEEYKKFWREWRETTPEPVHYIPDERKWVKLENGDMKRIENVPLPGKFTKELNEVITGGEMIIQGFLKKGFRKRRVPRFWMPRVRDSVIYSEVLDKFISVLITDRAIGLILEHGGFDSYVLKTKACDLGSLLSLRLKRRILIALRDKILPYDEEKNLSILKKYEPYMLPAKEIEWYGLTIMEALLKLDEEEEQERLSQIKPLKHIYRQNLIQILKDEKSPESMKYLALAETKSKE